MDRTQQEITSYYDRFYAEGEFPVYPAAYSRRLLRTLCRRAGIPSGASVLDVGCATGFYSGLFASLGYEVTGIDVSTTGIEKARARHPGIRFEVRDATTLTERDGQYDLVFAMAISTTNTRDMERIRDTVNSLLRVTVPGGTLVFVGGSRLTGTSSPPSNWYSHTWEEIGRIAAAPDHTRVNGPWLTHFRLMRWLPASLALNTAVTGLLRILPLRFERRIVIFWQKEPEAGKQPH